MSIDMSESPIPSITPNKNAISPNRKEIWQQIGLREESEQWKAISVFAFKDRILPPDLLEAPLSDVAAIAYRLQNVSRKVSGEPYFKHVMRTVMLVAQEEETAQLEPSERRILLSSALLHDAVELQRKLHRRYGREELLGDLRTCSMGFEETARIASIVLRMTPAKEGALIKEDSEYIKYKLKDFEKKFEAVEEDSAFIRTIKSADTLANLEETVEDLAKGRNDTNMGRPLQVRKSVFEGRIRILEKRDPSNSFLPRLKSELALLNGS